jgi:hypothetical protein
MHASVSVVTVCSLLLLAVMAAGGCSSSGADPASGAATGGFTDYRSGTRLRASVAGTADVAAVKTLHDAQLDVDCSFQMTKDGAHHCTPSPTEATGYIYFNDAACTNRVLTVKAGCAPPKYATSATSCPYTQRVFPVGAKAGPVALYAMQDGKCVSSGASSATDELYAVGDELDLSMFVKGSKQRRPGTPHLEVQYIVGDDGSEAFDQYFDTQLSTSCNFPSNLPTGVCAPPTAWDTHGEFTDSACANIGTVTSRGGGTCADDPPFVDVNELDACGVTTFRIARVGAAYSGPVYTRFGDGTCGASMPADSWHTVVDDIPVNSLPLVTHGHAGSGRVQHRTSVSDGVTVLVSGLYDSQLDAPCSAATTTDGKLRCVLYSDTNSLHFYGIKYADAACTNAVVLQSAPAECTKGKLPTFITDYADAPAAPACGERVATAYTVGGAVPLSTYYEKQGTGCAVQIAKPTDLFTTLTVLDPAMLAELSLRTE